MQPNYFSLKFDNLELTAYNNKNLVAGARHRLVSLFTHRAEATPEKYSKFNPIRLNYAGIVCDG